MGEGASLYIYHSQPGGGGVREPEGEKSSQ